MLLFWFWLVFWFWFWLWPASDAWAWCRLLARLLLSLARRRLSLSNLQMLKKSGQRCCVDASELFQRVHSLLLLIVRFFWVERHVRICPRLIKAKVRTICARFSYDFLTIFSRFADDFLRGKRQCGCCRVVLSCCVADRCVLVVLGPLCMILASVSMMISRSLLRTN